MAAQITKNSNVNHPVCLSEGKVENISDAVNIFFEYFIFFRWIFFKNRPRGNLLLIRSAIIVSVFAVLFFQFFHDFTLVLEGIEIDPAIAFAGAVVIGFWYMTHVFHQKSEACSEMYTEMIKAGGGGHTITAKMLSNALAIELLTLDLWAHRKYRALFAKNLYRAIEHAYSADTENIAMDLPGSIEEMVEMVNSRNLQAKEARILLDNYQDYLMFKANSYYSSDNAA